MNHEIAYGIVIVFFLIVEKNIAQWFKNENSSENRLADN